MEVVEMRDVGGRGEGWWRQRGGMVEVERRDVGGREEIWWR